jgi:hypothetical protein
MNMTGRASLPRWSRRHRAAGGGGFPAEPESEAARQRRTEEEGNMQARLNFVKESDDLVLYCEIKENRRKPYKRIAKRHSGQHWISIEPGWTVSGAEPGANDGRVCINYDPVETH